MSGLATRGRPFEASVRSTDANAGVAVPLYEPGTSTVITLGSDEYIEVGWLHVITVAGGDTHVILGADASIGTNEEIVRGDYTANGGYGGVVAPAKVGAVAATMWITSPAGVVTVRAHGVIRRVDNTGARPSWRASQVPGQ